MIRNLFEKFELKTLNRKQKIILSITGIAIVLLSLIGLTYGYFVTRVVGNTNETSISISTENLELTYSDGNGSISATDLKPDTKIEKTFTVSNTGTGTVAGYGVFLEDVINTFERTNDLQLKITCDSSLYGEDACNGYEGASPYQNDYLLQNSIEKDETHTYTLSLTYIEAGVDQSVDMGKNYSAKVQIYSTGETVDLEGSITNYAEGDYVVVNSTPKKSFIRSGGTFKVVGLLPGNHTVEVYAKGAASPKYSKTFTIAKGNGTTNATTAYINDLTRTIISTVNVTSKTFAITGAIEKTPIDKDSLAGAILANGATYVSSWIEGKSYYHGKECGTEVDCSNGYGSQGRYDETIGFEEFTSYTPNGTKNEKLLKTVASYGESADNGLFMAEDDYGVTYYFKGSIINNYVEFAGLDWRIVRINGDGSVRLILADTTKNLGVGEDSKFNMLSDDAYVGYMYGTPNSNSYDSVHRNINDSTIKTKVDLFYETYLEENYSHYLSDTLFCANKNPKSGYGFVNFSKELNGDWSGYSYLDSYTSFGNTISFKCAEGATNTYSRYTANSTKTSKDIPVNSDLDYPIGLLSYEEYNLAGGKEATKDNKNYLTTNNNVNTYLNSGSGTDSWSSGFINAYWLMSPKLFSSHCSSDVFTYDELSKYYVRNNNAWCVDTWFNVHANIIGYTSFGNQYEVSTFGGVRPVINVKSNIKVKSGDGTEKNPYEI